jgi:hypothetical protein
MQLFSALLFFLFSTGALAHWTKVIETQGTVQYVDLETIEKQGDYRRVMTVHDLKQRGSQGEMSFRRLLEFDCEKNQYRVLWIAGHSGSMAGGTVLGSGQSPNTTWNSISKGNAVEASLRLVCGRG